MALDKSSKAHLALISISGAISVWLSYPAVFVLAGIGISLLIAIGPKKDHPSLGGLAGVFTLWILSFSVYYLLFMRPLKSNQYLLSFWGAGFMPVPTSVGAIKTWGSTLQSLLEFIGYPLQYTVFITALIAVSIADATRKRHLDSLSLVLTIVVTLVASVLHQYPLAVPLSSWLAESYGRLILFLVPLFYLLIVRGLQSLTEQSGLLISLLLTSLLLIPFLSSALSLFNPIVREEVRPVLNYLGEHYKSNDQVYVYYRGFHAVKYYNKWYVKLPEQNFHWGKYSIQDQPPFNEEIASMKQWPRVWFLFSHRFEDEEIQFLSHIDGELLDQYHVPRVSLYLYNFGHR
jgi:hypothetical protein